MKISFAKIANNQIPFELNSDGLIFNGELGKINQNLVSCKGRIVGEIAHNCDRCGEDINLKLEEVLTSEIEAFKSDYFYCEKCKNL